MSEKQEYRNADGHLTDKFGHLISDPKCPQCREPEFVRKEKATDLRPVASRPKI